jgi:hypothetical protein
MNRSVSLLNVALVLLLFAAAPASGQKVTISNTVIVGADVFTDHNVQDTFGAYLVDFGKLKVGKYDQIVKSIVYLKFFLKSLPQHPINYFPLYGSNKTATLRLWYIPQWGYSPRDLYIYRITANPFAGEGDNWQEGNLVSNDPPPGIFQTTIT